MSLRPVWAKERNSAWITIVMLWSISLWLPLCVHLEFYGLKFRGLKLLGEKKIATLKWDSHCQTVSQLALPGYWYCTVSMYGFSVHITSILMYLLYLCVWYMYMHVCRCLHMCVYLEARGGVWCPALPLSAFLIPLSQGLALNQELSRQPAIPS